MSSADQQQHFEASAGVATRMRAEGARAERARIVARLRSTAAEVREGDAGLNAFEWLEAEADDIEATA